MSVSPRVTGAMLGLSAAALFGVSAPVAKLLLPSSTPLLLALLGFGEHLGRAGALMATGVVLLLRERHGHVHTHAALEHEHLHVHDAHHPHAHPPGVDATEPHSHAHRHEPVTHEHPHVSDLHHRHKH